MKGIELSQKFFEAYGRQMLENDFATVKDRIAVGLVGHGSECFGYDDEISTDHDFDAGFCIWLTEEDEREYGFKLFRAYSRLPHEFEGVKIENKSVFGSQYKGVHTIKEFYSFYLPSGDIPQSLNEWLSIPSTYLAEATNGAVFYDRLGEFTRIREALLNGYPSDVRLKKLASALFYMAQAGQYNYARCLKHGETESATLALNDFVRNGLSTIFLLSNKYEPYYKWVFRAADEIKGFEQTVKLLKTLTVAPTDKSNIEIIEAVSSQLVDYLVENGVAKRSGDYLEGYAYAVNEKIRDGNIRNMPIML